ncbi:MAG TPA: hypothetical protein VH475_02295 [Tepidisphaeraceae bacterium]|jgi:hypothetical protein
MRKLIGIGYDASRSSDPIHGLVADWFRGDSDLRGGMRFRSGDVVDQARTLATADWGREAVPAVRV